MERISNGIIEGHSLLQEYYEQRNSLEAEYESLSSQLSQASIQNDIQFGNLLLEEASVSELQKETNSFEDRLATSRNDANFLHKQIEEERNLQAESLKKFEIEIRELTSRFKSGPKIYNRTKLQEEISRHRAKNNRLTLELENLSKELEDQCNRFGIILSQKEDQNSLGNDSLNRLIKSVVIEQKNDSINNDHQLHALSKELDQLERATRELREELHNLHI